MKKETKCIYCGKSIIVEVPNMKANVDGCSCNHCVPENSPARDGINESIYTECKDIENETFLQNFKNRKDKKDNSEEKMFYVPVEWIVTDKVPVVAKNATEAVQFVLDNMDDIPLGDNPFYLDGSYKIYSAEGDTAEEIVEELQDLGYLLNNN